MKRQISSSKNSNEKLPKIAPNANEITTKIDPMIANPTRIGIFLNEPKKNITILFRNFLKNTIIPAINFL